MKQDAIRLAIEALELSRDRFEQIDSDTNDLAETQCRKVLAILRSMGDVVVVPSGVLNKMNNYMDCGLIADARTILLSFFDDANGDHGPMIAAARDANDE